MSSADLEGRLVVSVEQAVAAPYASARLADAGARVIKIERPEGDFARSYDRLVRGQSAYFVWLNRGKQSVCIDLRSHSDRELLAAMIARADVFIQNLRPGVLADMGFGSRQLRERHPRLISCEITGFGTSGPRSDLKAYDLIVQGESGLCEITGNAMGPARVGVSVCDIAAGMTAHAAILQALLGRERTGEGRCIGVSLFDSIADWMNVPVLQFLYGGAVAQRTGVNHPTIAPYGACVCADAVQIIFSVQNDREWLAFCETFLDRPQLARDPRFIDNTTRVENRAILDEIVCERFVAMTGCDAMRRLQAAGVAYGRLNTIEQAAVHPHLRFVHVDTPEGEIRMIAPAAVAEAAPPAKMGAVPRLGQHTDLVKAEFAV